MNERNTNFIDAPVSGGEMGAQNGSLSIMTGGNENVINTIIPITVSYSKSITHMGKIGTGQLAKMANKIYISRVLQGLSEALVFAKKTI